MATDTTRNTARENSDGALGPSDPSDRIEAVTKSDSVNFTNGICRCINAAEDGLVNLVMSDDTVVSNYQLHKGYNPVVCKRVNTGGDAINMWALF